MKKKAFLVVNKHVKVSSIVRVNGKERLTLHYCDLLTVFSTQTVLKYLNTPQHTKVYWFNVFSMYCKKILTE